MTRFTETAYGNRCFRSFVGISYISYTRDSKRNVSLVSVSNETLMFLKKKTRFVWSSFFCCLGAGGLNMFFKKSNKDTVYTCK